MKYFLDIIIILMFLIPKISQVSENPPKQRTESVKKFLDHLEKDCFASKAKVHLAEWEYLSYMSDKNLQKYLKTSLEVAKEQKSLWDEMDAYNWKHIPNENERRQFLVFTMTIGHFVLPPEKISELEGCLKNIKILMKFKVPKEDKPSEELTYKDLLKIMTHSKNSTELSYYWTAWHNAIPSEVRTNFKKYVNLMNEAATLHGLKNAGEMWTRVYEIDDIKTKSKQWWSDIEPLYKQFHGYIRYKLREFYGDVVPAKGAIPVHLLGDMWGLEWSGISDIVMPYPNVTSTSFENKLLQDKWTVKRIVKTANGFMTSLNFTDLPKEFWRHSIFESRGNEKRFDPIKTVTHINGTDIRAKGSLTISEFDFFKGHWLIFIAHFFNSVAPQTCVFQERVPSLTHGISECLVQHVRTVKYLKKLGLITEGNEVTNEENINSLFKSALFAFSGLPYAYLVDLYKWNVFSGEIKSRDYNCAFWNLRYSYQGVEPPVNRTEENFDPASKEQVLNIHKYFSYFFSMLLTYQTYRALCHKADKSYRTKDLYQCNIFGNVKIGNLLKDSLALGWSKPLSSVLEFLTGEKEISTKGVLEYFEPLMVWLKNEIKKNKIPVGWEGQRPVCD